MNGQIRRYEHGVSLVELMVAMVVGMLLLLGVMQIFISSKATYNAQESLSRLQESGRFAAYTLTRHLRMTGYVGCGHNTPVHNNLDVDLNDAQEAEAYDFTRGLYGSEYEDSGPDADDPLQLPGAEDDPLEGSWSPGLPSGLGSDDILGGSDVLVVRGATSSPLHALGAADNSGNPQASDIGDSAQFFVDYPNDIAEGDILMITDCQKSSIFQVTGVTHQDDQDRSNIQHSGSGSLIPGNQSPTWDETYAYTSEVARVESLVFYVAMDDEDLPALYRARLADGTLENEQVLVEGVENMQLLYGVDTSGNGSVDEYVTADTVESSHDWGQVVAVRYALLVTSGERTDAVSDTTRTFLLAGTEVRTPADQHQRQTFTSTVSLRNRTQ